MPKKHTTRASDLLLKKLYLIQLMKKYLVILLLFISAGSYAQTLTFSDLTNLANLTNDEARSYLIAGRKFKLMTVQQIDGLQVEEFQNIKGGRANLETITIGMGTKSADGQMLHKISYYTNQKQYIFNLLAQTHSNGMNLLFRGNDVVKNIYLYSSYLYAVNIYLRLDESSGAIEIKQKDFPSY